VELNSYLKYLSIFVRQNDEIFEGRIALSILGVEQPDNLSADVSVIRILSQARHELPDEFRSVAVKPVSRLIPHLYLVESRIQELFFSCLFIRAISEVGHKWRYFFAEVFFRLANDGELDAVFGATPDGVAGAGSFLKDAVALGDLLFGVGDQHEGEVRHVGVEEVGGEGESLIVHDGSNDYLLTVDFCR